MNSEAVELAGGTIYIKIFVLLVQSGCAIVGVEGKADRVVLPA